MKNFIKKHIPFLIMCLALLTVIGFFIFTIVVKNNVTLAEQWTRGFARSYVTAFSKATSKIPVSITEISFIVVVISCVVFLAWGFSLLGNKKVWGFIHRVMMIVLVITGAITMYNATFGIAYSRAPLVLEKYEGEVVKEEIKGIATYFVEDCNDCLDQMNMNENGEILVNYSKKELIEKIRKEYDKLTDDYYHPYTPTAKGLFTSGWFTSVGIVGMYFGVLGEAHYNTHMTNAELPFSIAHEMAHGKGVAREDDAQLVALYICLNSEEPLLRYSAYIYTIERMISLTHFTGVDTDYKEVWSKMDSKFYKNVKYINDYWKGDMFLYDLGNKINDWYLKTFGEKTGTASYDDTPTEVDPVDQKIYLSHYQSLYYKNYFDHIDK